MECNCVIEKYKDGKMIRWKSGIITGKVFHIYDNLTKVWNKYIM